MYLVIFWCKKKNLVSKNNYIQLLKKTTHTLNYNTNHLTFHIKVLVLVILTITLIY